MLNKGNFGLGKFLENFDGQDISGPCTKRILGLRPLIMTSVDGHRFRLRFWPKKNFSYLKCMGPLRGQDSKCMQEIGVQTRFFATRSLAHFNGLMN